MRIIEAHALFGTLNHATLSFDKGLTVFALPNEAGKSTWCAFFRAMLYGMPARERSSAGYLAEKERYRPWRGGEDAFGRMVVFFHGRNIVLQRTFSETGRTKEFKAYYEDTGSDVSEFSEENCGEILCGVGREAFEKSGFIAHNSMASADSSELERKIQALASSGDEEISFYDARSRLERLKNDIRVNKAKGMIPRLEMRLAGLDENIAAIRRLANNETSLRAKLLAIDTEKEALKKEIALIEAHEAYDRSRQLETAHEQTELSLRAYEQAKQNVTFAGRVIDRTFLSETFALISSVREKKAAKAAQGDMLRQLQADYEQAVLQLNALKEPENTKKFQAKTVIISAVLMEAGAAAAIGLSRYLISGILASAGIAVLIYGFLRRTVQKKQSVQQEQAKAARVQFEQIVREKEIKQIDARSRCEQAEKEYEAASETLISIAEFLKIPGKMPEEIANELNLLDQKVSEFSDREYKLNAAKETEAALRLAISAPQTLKPNDARPQGEIKDYKNKLSLVNEEYATFFGEVNAAKGRMQQIGDLSKLESEREIAGLQINRLQSQYAALEIAAEVLATASEELSKRVSPLLAQTAGWYFEKMTGGKYAKVLIKQGLRELLAAQDDGKMREILWFSQGTADQLYLALRLALCDLILKSDDLAPLILDDVLISFDDARLRLALGVLEEIAQKRQVILFSCHDRERAFLSEKKKRL